MVTDNNSTVVDIANREAIKFFEPRRFYKSYVNNISLFGACFSKLKFRLSEKYSKFISRSSLSACPNNLITTLEIFRLYGITAGAYNRNIDKRLACNMVWLPETIHRGGANRLEIISAECL